MMDKILKIGDEAWRWRREGDLWHLIGNEPWPAGVEPVVVGYDRKGGEIIGAFIQAREPAPKG